MTDDYQHLMAYVDRLELYIAIVVSLFVLSVIATALFIFWSREDNDD